MRNFPAGAFVDLELPVRIGHGEVRMIEDADVTRHPGMDRALVLHRSRFRPRALGIRHSPFAGTLALCSPLLALDQKKLWTTGAGFFTTMASPIRAQVTRSTNMQQG